MSAVLSNVAFSGDWMNGYHLEAALDTHDCKTERVRIILNGEGEIDLKEGGVEMIPGLGHIIREGAQNGYPLYHLHLPYGVDVLLTGARGLDISVKMPPLPSQTGRCGNFNGLSADDGISTEDNLRAGEAFFFTEASKMVQKTVMQNMSQNESVDEEQNLTAKFMKTCSPNLYKRATEACKDVLEEFVTACVMDICITNQTGFVTDTILAELEETEIENMPEEKEARFVGEGFCTDMHRLRYTTYEATGLDTYTECNEMAVGLAANNDAIRGTEFVHDDSSTRCYIVVDSGKTLSTAVTLNVTLSEHLIGNGNGIISHLDLAPNRTCWKLRGPSAST